MRKEDLARRLARESHLSQARARDQVDRAIHNILKNLREGKPVAIPGLGKLVSKPGKP